LYKNTNILLKYLQGIDKPIKFVTSKNLKAKPVLKKIYCWVVKLLADTPPRRGGGDHGKPEAG